MFVSVDSHTFLIRSSISLDGLLLEKNEEQALNVRVAAKIANGILWSLTL